MANYSAKARKDKFRRDALYSDSRMLRVFRNMGTYKTTDDYDRVREHRNWECNQMAGVDSKSRYDGIGIDVLSGKDYLVEHKERNTFYPEIMLEKKKVDACLELAAEGNYAGVIYSNTFKGSNVAYVFFITPEVIDELETEIRSCPKTTSVNSKYIDKEVYMLNIKEDFCRKIVMEKQ